MQCEYCVVVVCLFFFGGRTEFLWFDRRKRLVTFLLGCGLQLLSASTEVTELTLDGRCARGGTVTCDISVLR